MSCRGFVTLRIGNKVVGEFRVRVNVVDGRGDRMECNCSCQKWCVSTSNRPEFGCGKGKTQNVGVVIGKCCKSQSEGGQEREENEIQAEAVCKILVCVNWSLKKRCTSSGLGISSGEGGRGPVGNN